MLLEQKINRSHNSQQIEIVMNHSRIDCLLLVSHVLTTHISYHELKKEYHMMTMGISRELGGFWPHELGDFGSANQQSTKPQLGNMWILEDLELWTIPNIQGIYDLVWNLIISLKINSQASTDDTTVESIETIEQPATASGSGCLMAKPGREQGAGFTLDIHGLG